MARFLGQPKPGQKAPPHGRIERHDFHIAGDCIAQTTFGAAAQNGYVTPGCCPIPCQSDGDQLIIYHEDKKTEWVRFNFPRQVSTPKRCISDFYLSKESGQFDVFGCSIVTVGTKASDKEHALFKENSYSDYLYLHGLSVETAEARCRHTTLGHFLGRAGRARINDGLRAPMQRQILVGHLRGRGFGHHGSGRRGRE